MAADGIDEKGIEEALDANGGAKALQLLQAAMALGVLLFGTVTGILYASGAGGAEARADASVETVLSVADAVMAVFLWIGAIALFPACCRSPAAAPSAKHALSSTAGGGTPGAALAGRLRGAWILRLALLEGSALFGIVVCLIGALDGTLREQPVFWLNAIPAILFLVFAAATFPTRDRLLERLREMAAGET